MMSMKQSFPSSERAVEVYRSCAGVPSLSSATIQRAAAADSFLSVHSRWSERDLDRETSVKFSCSHLIALSREDGKSTHVINSGSITELNSEQLVRWSPSGQLKAVLRKVKDKKGDEKQYMEVWDSQHKIHNVNLTALDQHGKVNEDGDFGCLEWSKDESKLLYIAEKKTPKASSYFDRPKGTDNCEQSQDGTSKKAVEVKGDQFLYRQDWGEQLVGKHCPVPCILDLTTAKVTVPEGRPDDVSVGQGVWTPDGRGIVFVGWQNEPYRLGLIYCRNRRSAIYHLDLTSNVCAKISVTDQSVRSPKFSPDGSRLVYIRNPFHGPHNKCGQLMVCDWASKETKVAVDIVHTPTEQNPFPGLYLAGLESRCWLDNDRLIASSPWKSNKAVITINITTGEVVRLTNDQEFGSWTFCDISEGFILAYRASPINSGQLVLGTVPKPGEEGSIEWTPLQDPCLVCTNIDWSVINIKPLPNTACALDFEAIILKPKASEEQFSKPPLIVWPHGGPHSVFSSDYMVFCAAFCRLGFVIALVNYRGSIGFGQDSVDSLPGFVGTNDVQDVHATAEEVLRLGWADPHRVVVSGGSHGGFLSTHMIGQYPDFYKACITRNPVTNIAAMLGTSDIPSWTMTEVGMDFEFSKAPSPEMYARMFNSSPMAHVDKVKAPTLIMLGSDDLRVPPAQGLRFHQMLKARGVKTRLLMYPENSHPISKVDAEADCFMNMYIWLTEHLSN